MENGVIVCVDDERVVLNGLRAQLIREFSSNYSIEMAESGEEALELIKELLLDGKNIPIVITDQLMPGIKGHELLIEIHKLSPLTHTVLLTGQSNLEAVAQAVNFANLYRYLTKPWESQDLIMTIKEAIKSYTQTKQLEELKKLLEIHSHLFSLIKE